jgi:hypothetical protein
MSDYYLTKIAYDRISRQDKIRRELLAKELERERESAALLGAVPMSIGAIAAHSLAEKKINALKNYRKVTIPAAGIVGAVAGGRLGLYLHDHKKG